MSVATGHTASAKRFIKPQYSRSLNSEYVNCLRQRCQRVAEWRIFVRYYALESQVRDRLCHEMIVQLLRLVYLVPSGISPSVEMGDVLDIVADRTDHVAFHNLH